MRWRVLPKPAQTERRSEHHRPRKQQTAPATKQQFESNINSGIRESHVAMLHPRKCTRRIVCIARMKYRTECGMLIKHQRNHAWQRSSANSKQDSPASLHSVSPNQSERQTGNDRRSWSRRIFRHRSPTGGQAKSESPENITRKTHSFAQLQRAGEGEYQASRG